MAVTSIPVDRLLAVIKGPNVIVGPALIYRDDMISMIVAHGAYGSEGVLTEVILGSFSPELSDEWMRVCVSIISMRRVGEITMTEAKEMRMNIISFLRQHFRYVMECDTDLSLARNNVAWFPSAEARSIAEQVARDTASYAK